MKSIRHKVAVAIAIVVSGVICLVGLIAVAVGFWGLYGVWGVFAWFGFIAIMCAFMWAMIVIHEEEE